MHQAISLDQSGRTQPQALRSLRVAVIGGGLMGRRHAHAYKSVPGVDLVAIADIDPETCKRLTTEFGCRTATDWRLLLDEEQLDAVSICLPDRFHLEAALAAFDHDLAVLLEKPLATDPVEAVRIAEMAQGHQLLVGHMLRFDPRYQMARQALATGRVGELVHLTSRRNSAVGAVNRYGDTTSLVWHVAVHDLDLLQWTASRKITEVMAHGVSKRLAAQNHYDSVLVLGRLADDIPFSMEFSWILPGYFGSALDAGLAIVGTQGRIEVQGFDQGLRIADNEALRFPDTARWVEYDDGAAGGILAAEINHFARCIRSGEPMGIDVADALSTVRAAEAIERSLRLGQPVRVAT